MNESYFKKNISRLWVRRIEKIDIVEKTSSHSWDVSICMYTYQVMFKVNL